MVLVGLDGVGPGGGEGDGPLKEAQDEDGVAGHGDDKALPVVEARRVVAGEVEEVGWGELEEGV